MYPSREEASNSAKQEKGKEKVEDDEKKELTIEELEAKIYKDKTLLRKMKEERNQRDNTTSSLEQRKRKTMARAQERVLR